MKISDWHEGKLRILVTWGAVVVALCSTILAMDKSRVNEPLVLAGPFRLVLFFLIPTILVVLSVIHWTWYSAREKERRKGLKRRRLRVKKIRKKYW